MNRPSGYIEPNERVTFSIKYEDNDLLVVEKPTRVVTQPGVGHEHDTLLNGLFVKYGKQLQQLGQARDFGLVHRLDRETSGVMLVALTAKAYDGLRKQFEERKIVKYYWALCHKAPKDPEGVIRRPILDQLKRTSRYTSVRKASISGAGKPALTAYRVLSTSNKAAMIEARPVTGRLHQVRIHMDLIGSAVLGDKLYGPKIIRDASPRLALHAHRIVFTHPVKEEKMDISSKWPKDLRNTLNRLDIPRPDLKEPTSKISPVGESESVE
ncbi:MAG: RluA family pseudouridine synthase [Phycisphaerales bacterium]|nr:RluA family pseudouridine synthase [Phycisphaerales bacterium]